MRERLVTKDRKVFMAEMTPAETGRRVVGLRNGSERTSWVKDSTFNPTERGICHSSPSKEAQVRHCLQTNSKVQTGP